MNDLASPPQTVLPSAPLHPDTLPAEDQVAAKDAQQIRKLKQQIRNYVKRHGSEEEQRLLKLAIEDISRFHANQRRRSGQPVIIHPLRVANSICQAGLDAATVVAALLHDAIEDTPMTKDYVREHYGPWYAAVVDGLTKIQSPEGGKSRAQQEATYRKMLRSMTKDVRGLFIKLFDRLDNMRDMEAMPQHKRRRISRETLNVYVPLAQRLGLEEISRENSELCFRYLYPVRYRNTKSKLEELWGWRREIIESMQQRLQELLSTKQVHAHAVESLRVDVVDHVYPGVPLDHILKGFLIVVETPLHCYQALGVLHTHFSAVPLQIRDYISNPLWNGHQGLQTMLLIEGERISIEIVTPRMREGNRHGVMAFWQGTPSQLADYYRTYLDQLDQVAGDEQLRMTDVLKTMQNDQIQVFSPKGEVFALPQGATVLDFAYTIHTELGNHCSGAMLEDGGVRGTQRVPRDRQLNHGERVRILTDPSVQPSREWLNYATLAKSQLQVRRSIGQANAQRMRKIGYENLQSLLAKLQFEIGEWLQDPKVQAALEQEKLTVDRFLQEIGMQKRFPREFMKKHGLLAPERLSRVREMLRVGRLGSVFQGEEAYFRITNWDDPMIRFEECCAPMPGDRIAGLLNEQNEIEVHQQECNEMLASRQTRVQVMWDLPKDEQRSHTLRIHTSEGPGVLYRVAKVIKDSGASIRDAQVSVISEEQAYHRIRLAPVSWNQYRKICEGLRSLKVVQKVW